LPTAATRKVSATRTARVGVERVSGVKHALRGSIQGARDRATAKQGRGGGGGGGGGGREGGLDQHRIGSEKEEEVKVMIVAMTVTVIVVVVMFVFVLAVAVADMGMVAI